MAESDGVRIVKSNKPSTDRTDYYYVTISGVNSMGGATIFPIRYDKKDNLLKIDQYILDNDHKPRPLLESGGRTDLTYPGLKHHIKVDPNRSIEEQAKEWAEEVAKAIREDDKKRENVK